MRSSSPAAATLLACLLALAQVAVAHFTVFSPAPSRDKQAYPADNRRFWPIGPAHLGEGVLRPVRDCMAFPRRQTATVAAGSTVNFGFEIGNGAAHVGLCTGRIINLDSGAQYPLAEMNNCVSNGQNFRAVMPNVACPRCVAKIMVTAVHLGAERPEFYDSCVDLVITGGSAADPAPVQPPTRPTAVPSPSVPPVQQPGTTVPTVRPTTPAAVVPTPPVARPTTSAAATPTTTTQSARPTEPQVKPSPPASLIPQEPIVQPSTIKTATTTTTTSAIPIPTIKTEPAKPETGLEAHPIMPKPVQQPAEPTPAPQPKPQPSPAQPAPAQPPQPQPQPQPPKTEPQPAPQPQKPELPRTPRVADVQPWWEQGPCKSGAMACGRDGSTLRFCMGGKWIVQAVAQGKKCEMTRDGQVPIIVRE